MILFFVVKFSSFDKKNCIKQDLLNSESDDVIKTFAILKCNHCSYHVKKISRRLQAVA